MDPNQSEHWRGQPSGPPQQHGNSDVRPPQPGPRPFGAFGTAGQSQGPPVLPPPSQPYHHQSASGSHGMSIADLTQGPPSQQPQYNTAPPPPPQHSTSMAAALNHQLPHQSPPQYMNRDIRDREQEHREREMREQQRNLDMQRQQGDNMLREREARDREQMEQMERMLREQQQKRPVQSHTGSIPIHQPVATNIKNSAHGPNGLLSNGGVGPGPAQQSGPPPTSGPNNVFSIHSQAAEPPRQYLQHQPVQAPPPQPAPGFLGGPSPMPGQAQLAQGQQPILNDALSYLDQVKVRFNTQPDVYNRFLDIMKDFKSQAIDTPGVIERVSNLFNGHPALIQGFNTFLPPGYRIECGTDDNPDAIRVTTPSGTMTQSLRRQFRTETAPEPVAPEQTRPLENYRGWAPMGQQMSPNTRPYEQQGPQPQPVDPEAANRMHQQEQQGVSQLTTAVSAATNGINRLAQASPGPQGLMPPSGGLFGMSAQQRPPVEFNHAISYVNKIKNRFAQQPDIYKQFLEILQTYQRDSVPIGEVYAQVTQLFRDAPDLLEDFKQFLPESAAHAKQLEAQKRASDEAAMQSHIRGTLGEQGYGSGQVAQAQTPRPPAKMPPMGQFDPPSTSKENKKRRAPGIGQIAQPVLDPSASSGRGLVQVPNANKRQKISSQRPQAPEPMVSPTLNPQVPEPLPPYPPISTTSDELGFFDRAKKYIGNRASYTEFMKLINLFSNDLIDKHALCDRVGAFLAGNPELMRWFTDFLGIEEQEEIIEARARADPGRVNLSMCRSLGPSYRHLPKRDQNKPCKGRDAMCNEVLNDVWASHPTWASEDSGFIAHRKNQYEETMHRIEEERHDYDFHIEACQRTVQLMEPLVQQFKIMNEHDLNNFQLARGLGGASEAIPKRIILKIYGRETGAKVMTDLFKHPTLVLPIVLNRLKQKLEEWKHAQREWERIWREQIHKNFWKSLDHQGINARNLDKKNFQPKTLTSEVQMRYEERKKRREGDDTGPKWHLQFFFKDEAVLQDALALAYCGVQLDVQSSENEKLAMARFMEDFVAKTFDIDRDQLKALLSEQDAENGDIEPSGMLGDNLSRNRRGGGDSMRRLVMERRIGRDGSAYSGSRASTPAPATNADSAEASGDNQPPPDQAASGDVGQSADASLSPQPWTKVTGTMPNSPRNTTMDELQDHVNFNLYANQTLYCFFRLFEMLYSRLLAIKENEQNVQEAIYRWNGEGGDRKLAIELRMTDKGPDDFFEDVSPGANYYSQVLRMCRQVLQGSLEMSHLEELLRRYYNSSGWQLYAVERLIGAIVRLVSNMHNSESKDKSLSIADAYFKDRAKPTTSVSQETTYRKQVLKWNKDDVYRITFTPSSQSCTVRYFPPDTYDDDQLSATHRYMHYLLCYPMREITEGVDTSRMLAPFLRRNLSKQGKDVDVETNYQEIYGRLKHFDDQDVYFDPDLQNYEIRFRAKGSTAPTTFAFLRTWSSKKDYPAGKVEHSEAFMERFYRNVLWMRDERPENVEKQKDAWRKGVEDGIWESDVSASGVA